MASPTNSPNKRVIQTHYSKDSAGPTGVSEFSLAPQNERKCLVIQNKGAGRIGLGFGTKDHAKLLEMKGNSIWEFAGGNIPVNYIHFVNLDTSANAVMNIVVLSDAEEEERVM